MPPNRIFSPLQTSTVRASIPTTVVCADFFFWRARACLHDDKYRTILIAWFLHARFSSFVDVSATAWTQTKDVKERRKLCVRQETHTKKTQLQQKREASPRKNGTLILTAWRRDENRKDIERWTIKYFCLFLVWKTNLFKGSIKKLTKIE